MGYRLPLRLVCNHLSVVCVHSRGSAMLETNIRIIYPGMQFYLTVRRATVTGSDNSPDLLQRACNKLLYEHDLAAIPCPSAPATLLVATSQLVPRIHLAHENWELTVADAGGLNERLTIKDELSTENIV